MTASDADAHDDRRPIGFWIKRLDGRIDEVFDAALETEALSRRHWQVLHSLQRESATLAAVQESLLPFDADGHEVAAIVADLLARGWIAEETERLLVTAAGSRAHDRAAAEVAGVRERLMAAVTDEEYLATVDVLRRMSQALES